MESTPGQEFESVPCEKINWDSAETDECGTFPNSRLLVVDGVDPGAPILKHPETGPSGSIRRAGLRNNMETSAGKRIATDKTFVSILLLAAVTLFLKT